MKDTTAKARTKSLSQKTKKKFVMIRPARRTVMIFLFSWLASVFILVFEIPGGLSGREFMIGEPAPRTLFAPFEVIYTNDPATAHLRDKKSKAVPLVFKFDEKAFKEAGERLDRFFGMLSAAKSSMSPGQFPALAGLPLEISDASLKFLMEQPVLEDVRKNIEVLFGQGGKGLMDSAEKMKLLESGTNQISVVRSEEKSEKILSVRTFLTPGEIRDSAAMFLPEAVNKNRSLKNTVLEIFNAAAAPTLIFDEVETQARRKKAAKSAGVVEEKIKKDELIIQRGMLISPQDKVKLETIRKKLKEHTILNRVFSFAILAGLAYLLCFLYFSGFEKKILGSLRLVLLIHTVFLLTLALSKGIVLWPGSSPVLMPVALASALLVLLVSLRVGFLGGFVMTLLAAPLAKFQPDLILAFLVSGTATAFAAYQIRKRIQFLRLSAASGLAFFSVLFLHRIFLDEPVLEAAQSSAIGLASGFLIITPLCFLLLPILEWLFNLTTDITLLELSDLNHPLLKRMVLEAPGTYHHSLVVSALAESACEAIGANALLARVGCYFHDIGKMARADFFTENQAGKFPSRHEKLTPAMSRLIIMNHVKDGFEIGRQYKLKNRILQFIPEHQGTGVIYYFYRKALDHAATGEKIRMDDYRYPGPKPQSRETAVAMLADSTEAASRSLREPSPESIRQLVRKIINDKFIDGQLEECDLTLKDIHNIQESFVRNLMAIFHTRIQYPAAPAAESCDMPDLFAEEPPLEKTRQHPHHRSSH